MTDLELLTRFFGAWGQSDVSQRSETLNACMSPDATYADPHCPAPIAGPDGMAEMLAVFTERMPDARAEPISDVQSHNGFLYCTIAFMDKDEQMMRGEYFARRNGDKLDLIVGFPDTGKEA